LAGKIVVGFENRLGFAKISSKNENNC